jgi:hypothetical protein
MLREDRASVDALWWRERYEHFSGVGELEIHAENLFPLTFSRHISGTWSLLLSDIMAPSRSYTRLAWLLSLLAMFSMLCPTSALYFYLDGTTPKCFYEELPKDTMVVGM